jgi:uncharacterized membrane protein
MSEWTDEAMERWADFLDAVRVALSGIDDREVDAVIRDLEDHATRTFGGATAPVSDSQMATLIERLGTPSEIAALGVPGTPVSHEVGAAVGTANADRTVGAVLAYGSLALVTLALFVPATTIGALALAYVLARLGIRRGDTGAASADRWLFYPALGIGAVALAAVLALWPFALVLPLAAIGGPVEAWMRERSTMAQFGTTSYWSIAWGSATLVTGAWWLVLRIVLRRKPSVLPFLLHPFISR